MHDLTILSTTVLMCSVHFHLF